MSNNTKIKEKWVNEIIKTKEFLRLKKIKQLGCLWKTYTHATHTRFNHSIGAFLICKKVLEKINNYISTEEKNATLAAALLHDLGHGPLSHNFEFFCDTNHEEITKKIILEKNSKIYLILKKYNINVKKTIAILEGKYQKKFLSEIISSQIDVDRLDYINRDIKNLRLNNKLINLKTYINSIMIIKNKLVFDEKCLSWINMFLETRHWMYINVYEDDKNFIYADLIKKILMRLKFLYRNNVMIDKFNVANLYKPFFNNEKWTVKNFILLNDENFMNLIYSAEFQNDNYLKEAIKIFKHDNINKYIIVRKNRMAIKNIPDIFYCKIRKDKKKLYDFSNPIKIYDHQNNTIKNIQISKANCKTLGIKKNKKFILLNNKMIKLYNNIKNKKDK